MRYTLLALIALVTLLVRSSCPAFEGNIELSEQEEADLAAGEAAISELQRLADGTALSLEETLLCGQALGMTSYSIAPLATTLGAKKPGGNTTYYTINGNKDITIHGYEKQNLYAMATDTWTLDASYTLPVSNVGYLTYNDITLCDIDALKAGTDYSEFITNVQLNGFSTNFEYRLELHNGFVTLWSKIPGEAPAVPEAHTVAYLLAAAVLVSMERRRRA